MKSVPRLFCTLTFLLIFVCSRSYCQEDTIPSAKIKCFVIKSKFLNEDRTIWMYLPDRYDESTQAYPVLYLLDGDDHFEYVSPTVKYLSEEERLRIPQMIVVAILNTDRIRDFTPENKTSKVKNSQEIAGAENFLKFIKNELIPFVNKGYRTQPYRIIEGHSLGGLFTLYSMQSEPDLFRAHIIISPALDNVDSRFFPNFKKFLADDQNTQRKIFLSIGDEPLQKISELIHQIKQEEHESLKWTFIHYANEDHLSVPYKSMYDGLRFIYSNWFVHFNKGKMNGYDDIVHHFENLSKEFGYKLSPTEEFVNKFGYCELDAGRTDNAIDVFKHNIKNFPNSFNVYDSMGEAYLRKGDKSESIKFYKKSVLLNPKNHGGKAMLEKLDK